MQASRLCMRALKYHGAYVEVRSHVGQGIELRSSGLAAISFICVSISPSLPIVFLVKREDSKCRPRHYLAHSGGQTSTLNLWDPKEEGCYRQMVRALGAVA